MLMPLANKNFSRDRFSRQNVEIYDMVLHTVPCNMQKAPKCSDHAYAC